MKASLHKASVKLERAWLKLQFERSIRSTTLEHHDRIIDEAEQALRHRDQHESDAAYVASSDPLVRQGHALKRRVELQFRGLYAGKTRERILIQVPDPVSSPAGYSLFTNMAESLEFLGVPTHILEWHEPIQLSLKTFQPTVLLSSDHPSYLNRIDWNAVRRYQESTPLQVGLTASLAEYGSEPLGGRLTWAKQHGISFYYSFRDEDYVQGREAYRPFFDAGYPMLYMPFGANILYYYPVAGFARDLDFVLIASKKKEHMHFMKNIVNRYSGFIDGPGWKHAPHFRFMRERDRYVYARAKIGLNVHLPEQINWACEVNERTYQLAACGVPQVIDHPKLLDKLFSRDAMFVADTPKQYAVLFKMIINDPLLGQQRALQAQREVFDQYTTFHRADAFVRQLESMR
jgi:hypothetical protein